jgi:hypothetical protein
LQNLPSFCIFISMRIDHELKQYPAPGTRIVKFRGDTLTIHLSLPQSRNGSAWIRTNLGN